MSVYDIPDRFDRIGASIQRRMMKPAIWEPKGGSPVPVMIGFQAPKIYVDAFGNRVQDVQPHASGLATVFAAAKQGDFLVIGSIRWQLKDDPESYGGADLVRMPLAGPIKPRA